MTTEIKGGLLAQGSDSDVLRALTEARAIVAAGWVQGVYVKVDGHLIACCASEAINRATRNVEVNYSARNLLTTVTGEERLCGWNDTPGRTQAEVLAAFDRAIALAEGNDPKGPPGPAAAAPQETP